MTWETCSRLQPENRKIASATDFISTRSDSQSRKDDQSKHMSDKPGQSDDVSHVEEGNNKTESELDEKGLEPKSLREAESKLPNMAVNESSVLQFSKIPPKFPSGAGPSDVTKYSMDSSYALEKMLDSCYRGDENGILGEIQFSFICLLIGQVYDAFDQWKRLVHLVCSSEEALVKHENLFTSFITVLYFQVQEIPEDFFVDIVSQNNFLTTTLQEILFQLGG